MPPRHDTAPVPAIGADLSVRSAMLDCVAPDCVGPIALPAGLIDTLRALAEAAGADELVPLAVCAGVLAARLPHTGPELRARVIRGPHETVVPAAGAAELAAGFRDAIDRAAQAAATDPGPAAVTILISQDDRNLYVETVPDSGDVPSALPWARSFLQLLTRMADEPDAPLAGHPLIDTAERERIVHGLNPYQTPHIQQRTMTQPFEEQAARDPDAVALVDENGATVSYRELNERANRLAHYLRERGAGPGTRIGVCLTRGVQQIVAIYAAAKTGATYVPLDADLPDQRIAWIVEDSGPRHVLTDPVCRPRVPDGAWEVHDVHADAAWSGHPVTDPVVDASASGLLHILYTSGTTGRPKGVATTVGSALANVFWMQKQYPYKPGDTALFKASPGFDISIWEIFWPLYHGARVVLCRPGAERGPRHLARLAEDHGATLVFLVPTMMPAFLDEITADRAGALRWVVCGGEPMSPRIPETFYATLPGSHLINAFGPTEAGPVTDNIIEPGADDASVPVGRPADNFRITLLDANLDLVPVGTPGEAYISGDVGLAHGYWRAPARTAERFAADPYGPPGSRMYRTGDLCRFREDGRLEHLGRIDRQVKIRGLRVEPGEIESVLAGHPAVGDCAVIAHGRPTRLLAFVVPADRAAAGSLDPAAVQEHAAAYLPSHMRPERIVPVDRLPATVNGKIDQEALIAAWQELTDREHRIVPPADEVEAALVEIYGRLLATPTVSVLDTFVQLGGHSLLTLRLLDECQTRLNAAPDAAGLMNRTLREVAAAIRGGAHPAEAASQESAT
ncbi:MAG TPA: amino acid adenylation domain-containing protein [Streptosporangiaceae bacterium]|nr:amino acid adenylation domain-containing protein [Streptosporangiaceae bacterium]